MRAPPASYSPMIGALAFIAMSWILTIFCAWVSESEPPNTVKSFAKTNVLRPLTVPQPVTTPSPGTFVFSMPNSTERCSTNMSNSSNEPLSSNSSMRSRAVSLPRACCASMRFSPPPSFAPARRSSRMSKISFMAAFPPDLFPVLTRHFANRKRPPGIWQPCLAHDISAPSSGGETHGRYRIHRDGWCRDRRGTNASAAGGADAVCGDDAALRGLGRIVVGLRHPVFGAGPELRGLFIRPEGGRHRLQCRAQLHVGGEPDGCRIWTVVPAHAFHRDDLDGAYRHRPRARLWPEILSGIWLHPSWPHRQGRGQDCLMSRQATSRRPGMAAPCRQARFLPPSPASWPP